MTVGPGKTLGTNLRMSCAVPQRLHPRRWFFLAAVAGLALHLGAALPLYRLQDRFAAWLLLVVLLGSIRHYAAHDWGRIPVLVLVTAQIYVFYGLPQFTQDSLKLFIGLYSPTGPALTTAVWLVLAGELAFLGGYCGALHITSRRRNFFDRWVPVPQAHWAPEAIGYAGVSLIIYSLMWLRPTYVPLAFRHVVLQTFNAYLSIAILFLMRYRFGLRMCGWTAWGLVFVMTLVGIVAGVMGAMVYPFVAALMCLWLAGRASTWRWLVVIALGVLVLNPVKNEFRRLSWYEKDISSVASVRERFGDWADAFGIAWGKGWRYSGEANVRETADRASDLLFFCQAVDVVPAWVPYRYGEGLGTLAAFWVPRFIWPSKPSATELVNDVYAKVFGVSSEAGVMSSTVAVPPFLEGYWNFGIPGVVLFLAVYGVMLGLLLGNSGKWGSASVLVGIAFLGPSPFPLQEITIALSHAISVAGASCAAMWGLAMFAGAPSALRRTVSGGRLRQRQ